MRDAIDVPVILADGDVLDGRARVSEAVRLGIPCPYVNLSPRHHEHPALVLARAMVARAEPPDRALCALVCARLVDAVRKRPAWLDHYDSGFSARLHKQHHLVEFLEAGGATLRSYQRAKKILEDQRIVLAVLDGAITLRMAETLVREVPGKKRMAFVSMTDEQRGAALAHLHTRRHRPQRLEGC
ncbi:hypothetical protein AB4Y45_25490 [Paraburkholderia sp. EG287A]|uniref:hypothetical protein n=1 Tax=unclassified Paraburkholderia TaxID=2615204 RepID=UPI0034D31668